MSQLPPLPPIEPWPLAARLAGAPASMPWTLLAVPHDQIGVIAEELRDQLASLLPDAIEVVETSSPEAFLSAARRTATGVLIVTGLDVLSAEGWRRVDANRSRLSRERPGIIVIDESQLALVVDHAPNLWSWLSGSIWRGRSEDDPDAHTPA